jgi:exopolysaccharide biosynthesis polyprenyl glycosylphosphotransferase
VVLRKALRLQEERGGQLGRILVAAGGCTEDALARALLEQVRRRAERGFVDASVAARAAPALAGLRVQTRPLATVAALAIADAAALLLACIVGHAAIPLVAAVLVAALAGCALLGLYAPASPSPPDEIRKATAAVTLAFLCVAAVTALHGGPRAWSWPLVLVSWACALPLVPLARAVLRRVCASRAWWGHPVVVLGAGKAGRLVVRALLANPGAGLKPVVMLDDDRSKHGTLRARLGDDDAVEVRSVTQSSGDLLTASARASSRDLLSDSARARAAVPADAAPWDEQSAVRTIAAPERPRARGTFAEVEGVPVVGDLALAPVLARRLRVAYAVVAMPGVASEKLGAMVDRVGGVFSHLLVIPDLFGLASLGVPAREIDGILGLEVRQQLLLPWPRLAKRVMDVVLTVLGGACILPLLAAIALLVRLDSRGPALYVQDRLGRDGRRFRALKFRTMHGDGEARLRAVLDADPPRAAEYAEFHKLSEDPRVTRVGRVLRRYSLDELPQLWNVLRGEMSLVGPRPYLEREIPQMDRREAVILRALPGMTGLWQVGDRNATGFDARVATDVHYVRNWSPWLDVWVLARTFDVIRRGTGS